MEAAPTAPAYLKQRLSVLRYAARGTASAHAARMAELVRDFEGELYRSRASAAGLRRTLNKDGWLANLLAAALTPRTALTPALAALLLSLVPETALEPVLTAASSAFLTRADPPAAEWPERGRGVLVLLLTTPAYARLLPPRFERGEPGAFYVRAFEDALARSDETLARLLLQNAPGVFAAVRARDYRHRAGRRFARRVLREEAEREPRSLSLSQSELASDASDSDRDSDGEMVDILDELAASAGSSSDDGEASTPSLRGRTPPSQQLETYGYDGYAELLEDMPDRWWEPSQSPPPPSVGRPLSPLAQRARRASQPQKQRAPENRSPTFVHWPNLEKAVTAETEFGRTVAVLGGMEIRQQRLDPGYAVPFETHAAATQFLRTERGSGGVVQLEDADGRLRERPLPAEAAVMIGPGVRHRLVNRSDTEPWFFYTLYSPVVHGFDGDE